VSLPQGSRHIAGAVLGWVFPDWKRRGIVREYSPAPRSLYLGWPWGPQRPKHDLARYKLPYSLSSALMLNFLGCLHLTPEGAFSMEWATPQHEEIDLNCEVSSYANAEL
jgi:hypothetical protein